MINQKWNASDYAQNASAQLKWAMALIKKMTLTGSESILDIGCGDGKISAFLAKACPNGQVVGIDLSEDMINKATLTFPPEKYPNLTFKKMNASQLIFEEKFDLIFSNSALHWITNHDLVLQGIYAALKPGGKTYLKFGGKGTLDSFQPMLDCMLSSGRWHDYFKKFEPSWGFFDTISYTRWLKKTHLIPLSVKSTPSEMVHPNRQGLEGWVRTTWQPYLECVPEPLKNKFATELVNRYLERYPVDANGKTHVAMVRLEVIAQKGVI